MLLFGEHCSKCAPAAKKVFKIGVENGRLGKCFIYNKSTISMSCYRKRFVKWSSGSQSVLIRDTHKDD